jgi:alkaline phosphatase
VSIDHATPAVFYAHVPTRNDYHTISMQLSQSGFDYFGGGGFLQQVKSGEDALAAAQDAGYQVTTTREELAAVQPGQKVLAYNHTLDGSKALYYEIDRPDDHLSLAEFTAAGIRLLENPNGFFIMVEGGKIDWTCHANDGRTSIDDVLAFDAAVQEAIAFAAQHSTETLIVVTADHETGGLTQGWAGTKYASAYEILAGQTMSYLAFGDWLADYRKDPYSFYNLMKIVLQYVQPGADLVRTINLVDDKEMLDNLQKAFGLSYDQLSDFQKKQLEDAYDRSMGGAAIVSSEEDYLLYGGYDALAVTCTHILNARAGLGWTSYSHTAVPVPVLSNDARFEGCYDNTLVAKKIATVMGVSLN